MKRSMLLLAVLVALALGWGGLQWRERVRQQWLSTASVDALRTEARSHPDQADLLARAGTLLNEAGETAEAEPMLRRAVDLDPSADRAWVELSRSTNNDAAAIETLRQGLRACPDSAAVQAEMAHRLLLAGHGQEARDAVTALTESHPNSAEAWAAYGEVMAAARRQTDAENAYEKSLRLRDAPETRLALARSLIPLQRYDRVRALCAPLVQATPALRVSKAQRARALIFYSGARLNGPLAPSDLTAIQEHLREAEALSPQLAEGERFLPSYFLGECALRAGRPAEAIPRLERSVALGPQFPGSLYSLARAHRLAGHTAKADEALARHAKLSRSLTALDAASSREQPPK